MRKGGYLLLNTANAGVDPGSILITLGDTGVGIKPAEREKIFHPFYTNKSFGIGLGLSLAYRIIEAHSGQIWVCQRNHCSCLATISDKKKHKANNFSKLGAVFHVLLPMDLKSKAITLRGKKENAQNPCC